MYPYITLAGVKIAMTWIGIVVWFGVFLMVSFYLCRRLRLDFLKLFYWLGPTLIAMYFLGRYMDFVFKVWVYPINSDEWLLLLSPHGYYFHFFGVLLALVIALRRFIVPIKRPLEKKLWIDVFFFSIALALIPSWLFFLLWDDIIGKATSGIWWVKPLHADSALNTFTSVFPVWLFISLAAFISVAIAWIMRRMRHSSGMWLVWFAWLLFFIGCIMMIQQYPRHGVLSLVGMTFDIKQYIAWIVMIWAILLYYKWKKD